ncbi:tyrosine-type recombinase/integrase [Bacillus sp. FJAT-27231]|uniref:tyrosine-type recombinase/integrase n=1 Tax=Bacillus sp. FJAT-27231 TaxID=1679168 RepID=UPI00067126E3|nr:site-specific integrase [Bacillus sp. FJAT-27231]
MADLFLPKIVKAKKKREQLQKRNLLIRYLLYTTGLRASELLNLNWGSFRYSHQGHLFVDVIGKGKKQRPLFYALYNREETRHKKKRLTYAVLYKIVKEAVDLAGKNSKISPHWFRHTFVTMMLENDVPLAVVKDWAGHSDLSTINMYSEVF